VFRKEALEVIRVAQKHGIKRIGVQQKVTEDLFILTLVQKLRGFLALLCGHINIQ